MNVETVFLKLLNMSISASWLILAVCVMRLCLKRTPRFVTLLLWGLVALRLVCPFTVESVLSLVPSREVVPETILYEPVPHIESGMERVDQIVNPVLVEQFAPSPEDSVNPMQAVVAAASWIWFAGCVLMLVYLPVSYARLRYRLRTAVCREAGIWQSEYVSSPFVLGVVRPRIYLPFSLTEEETEYVLAHERAHLAGKDHLLKLFSWILLSVYWFCLPVWAAYVLFGKDIELACDERVIRSYTGAEKKAYLNVLLSLGEQRGFRPASPLAFGEIGIKDRVKNVTRYQRPAAVAVVLGVLLCIVAVVCFFAGPVRGEEGLSGDATEISMGQGTVRIVEFGQKLALDLDGDGKKEELVVTMGEETDMVNAHRGSRGLFGKGFPVIRISGGSLPKGEEKVFDTAYLTRLFALWNAELEHYYIFDLDKNDKYLELVFYDDGPSADPEFHMVRYADGELKYLGGFQEYTERFFSEDSASQCVPGDGTIYGATRVPVMMAYWNANAQWKLDADTGKLKIFLPEEYTFYYAPGEEKDDPVTLREITAFAGKEVNGGSIGIPKGTSLRVERYNPADGWLEFSYDGGTKTGFLQSMWKKGKELLRLPEGEFDDSRSVFSCTRVCTD